MSDLIGLENAVHHGYTLIEPIDHQWYSERTGKVCGCAVTAAAATLCEDLKFLSIAPKCDIVRHKFGMTYSEISDFIMGFDGESSKNLSPPYKLGAKLREKYIGAVNTTL